MWMSRSEGMLTWMAPGEVKGKLCEALEKEWVWKEAWLMGSKL